MSEDGMFAVFDPMDKVADIVKWIQAVLCDYFV